MAGAIPDIIIRLVADVDDFIRDWERAADAAERAAARIRAAGAAAGNGPGGGADPDTIRRFNDLNGELDRLTRNARLAADRVRELGNESRRAGESVEEFRRRLDQMGNGLGGATRGMGGMSAMTKLMYGAIALLASILPGVIAGIFALGAAAVGVGIAIGVVALGAKGLGQAFDGLQRAIAPLQRQLDSLFRTQLSDELQKLGQTINAQLTPAFKGVARAVTEVIKETSEWIRSSEGISTIKKAMQGVEDLVRALGPAVKGIVQIFVEFAAAAAPAMGKIGEAISEVVTSLRDMFREAQKSGQLQKIFEAGAEAVKGFGEIVKGLMMILMEMADQGGLPAAEAMKSFGKALQNAAPAIGALFANLARAAEVFGHIIEFATRFGDVLADIINPIRALQREFPKATKDMESFTKGFQKIAAAIPAAAKEIDKFVQIVKAAFDKAAQIVKAADDKINAAIKQGWDKANQVIKAAEDKMNQSIKQGFDKANQAVKQAMDKVNQSIKQGWDKATAPVTQAMAKINAAIKQGFDKANQEITQAVDKMVQSAREWWDKMVAAIGQGLDRANQAIKDGIDKIVQNFKSMTDQFVQAGKEMVEGLIKGAKAKVDELVNTFKAMAQAALAAAKAVLGIHSPSKVFADEVGQHIPTGIAQGITAGTPALQAALARTMRTLPMTANVALQGASRGAAIGLGSGTGKQVIEVKLDVGSGGDGAAGAMISGLARRGQLKLTANAIVGGRR